MQFCTENVTARFKSINLFYHRILIIVWQDAITESQSCYTHNSLIAASFTFGWCGNWNVESVNKLIPSFIKTEMCVDVMFDTKQIFSVLDILVSSNFFHFIQFLPEETGRNSYFPVSSGRPGRNTFLPEETQPWHKGPVMQSFQFVAGHVQPQIDCQGPLLTIPLSS